MPHHAACKKQIRKNKKQNIRNRSIKSRIQTVTKKVRNAKTKEEAVNALQDAYSIIDKASKTGIIHKNNASNKKSSLSKAVQKKS